MRELICLGVLAAAVCAFAQKPVVREYTVATLPAAASESGITVIVTDAATSSDCTTGGGLLLVACKSNGSAWSAPGSGDVTYAGTPTVTALITASSATQIQTPNTSATMDASGNISTPGTITAASVISSATTPGTDLLSAGTGNIAALPANSAGFAAPASGGTSFLFKLPGTAMAGLLYSAAPATGDGVNEAALSFRPLQGTDSNILTAGPISGTGSTLCTDAGGGATTTGCASGGSMVYPGAGIPNSTGTAWGTSYTAPSGNLVGTGQANTWTAGLQDLGSATVKLPAAAGYAPITAALFGYDSTNKYLVFGNGTQTNVMPWFTGTLPTSGHCAQWGASGQIEDAGAACGTSGLGDPGGNGIVYRNALDTTGPASAHNISAVLVCAAASGSGTAYTCSTSPTFTPASGDEILFKADAASTGSATLAVNGATAAIIKKQGGSANLAANDLLASQQVPMIFDGTNWQMQGQTGNAASGGTETAAASLPWFPWGAPSFTANGGAPAYVANGGIVQAIFVQAPVQIHDVVLDVKTASGTSCTGGTCGAVIGIYSADLTTLYCETAVGTSGNAIANLNINTTGYLFFPMASGTDVSAGTCTLPSYPQVYKLVLSSDSTVLALNAYGDAASSIMLALNGEARNAGQATTTISAGDGGSLALNANISTASWSTEPALDLFSFQ